MSLTPDFSFVVPVHNAAHHLERCLRSIAAADPGVSREVIVVDNGSSDDSVRIAKTAGTRVLAMPHARVGGVRNAGAKAAAAGILAFVDADNEIDRAWLSACAAAMADPTVAAAGLPYLPPTPATWVQRLYDLLRFRPHRQSDVLWLGAGNLAVRREVFEEVGGFDESLEACEDVAFCIALARAGHRVVAVPGMHSVHHGDPATLRALFVGELWRGRDNLRVSLRGGWRSVPGMLVPVTTLVLVVLFGASAVASPSLGWAWPALAAGGIVAIALLRTAVIVGRGRLGPRDWVQSLVVALTFELGRAFALFAVGTHRTRTRPTAA